MASIFSKIVQGEIPCHKVWEDEEHLAFLDIQPLAEGHTLVIPKRESDHLFDLSSAHHEALWSAAHKVAQRLKQKIDCERIAVLVLGYEVAHVHIHLIPTHSEAQVLQPKRQETDHSKLAQLATRIRGEDQTSAHLPNTQEVEERWDQFALRFVNEVEETSLRAARAGIDHLQLKTAKNILEIGCGGGGAGLEIYNHLQRFKHSALLTLTDISSEMVKIAQARFQSEGIDSEKVTIMKADAQALPFQDESFDRVFSCLNLMLVPDANQTISECARMLTRGGIGVWIVWGRPEYSPMMTLTGKALKEINIDLPQPMRSNFYLGGLDTLKEALEAQGFEKVRRWYQPMIADVDTGEAFTQMTLALRPELEDLVGSDHLHTFKTRLTAHAQACLDQGQGIGLDALIVIAHKA